MKMMKMLTQNCISGARMTVEICCRHWIFSGVFELLLNVNLVASTAFRSLCSKEIETTGLFVPGGWDEMMKDIARKREVVAWNF